MTDDTDLNAEALLSEAQRLVGLSDFGGPPDVVEPFTRLVDALNREARLSAAGRAGRRQGLLRVLVNRLRIQQRLHEHPEILDEKIEGPIVILGLARSGTTKLHRMIAADDQLQSLPLWKMMSPIGGLRGGPETDAERVRRAEQSVAFMRSVHPAFYAAHPMEARAPDEEVFLMELTFLGNLHAHGNEVPSYQAWSLRQSYRDWYAYLRRMLQLFQWQDECGGKPWLLKAPFHLAHLEELLAQFPHATLVHCHREPRTAIASMCGLFEASRTMFCDSVSAEAVGQTAMAIWPPFMQRYLDSREQLENTHRFVDLPYSRIVSDASACIAEVFDAAGREPTTQALAAMQRWESQNSQHKHGQHRYALERYGISNAEIDAAFADYRQRFAMYL